MKTFKPLVTGSVLAVALVLSGCGNSGGIGIGNGIFSKRAPSNPGSRPLEPREKKTASEILRPDRQPSSTIWDLFANNDDPNTTVEVNKYIWNAALDVLDFLPIQAADPFSGVIVTGYGTPPGGGRAYRATIFVQDPALDARSLNLALQSRGGPVSRETVQAVEDAILTRARQLRIADGRL